MTEAERTALARKIWAAAVDRFDTSELEDLHKFLTAVKELTSVPQPDPGSLAAMPSSLLLAELGLRVTR